MPKQSLPVTTRPSNTERAKVHAGLIAIEVHDLEKTHALGTGPVVELCSLRAEAVASRQTRGGGKCAATNSWVTADAGSNDACSLRAAETRNRPRINTLYDGAHVSTHLHAMYERCIGSVGRVCKNKYGTTHVRRASPVRHSRWQAQEHINGKHLTIFPDDVRTQESRNSS